MDNGVPKLHPGQHPDFYSGQIRRISLIKGQYGASVNKDEPLLRSMLRNGERLHRLINDLLDITRLEAGRNA